MEEAEGEENGAITVCRVQGAYRLAEDLKLLMYVIPLRFPGLVNYVLRPHGDRWAVMG